MIDHVGLRVADYQTSKQFFELALAPLGYILMMDHDISGAGFGKDGKPDFFIKQGQPARGLHIALSCTDRATVDAFHAAALSAGATCNGPPGPRTEYHPTYYGAFVLDPDGHNIEAVCHMPA